MAHEANAIALDALNGIVEVSGVVQVLQFGEGQLFEVDGDIGGLENGLDRSHELGADTVTGDQSDGFGGGGASRLDETSGQHLSRSEAEKTFKFSTLRRILE